MYKWYKCVNIVFFVATLLSGIVQHALRTESGKSAKLGALFVQRLRTTGAPEAMRMEAVRLLLQRRRRLDQRQATG